MTVKVESIEAGCCRWALKCLDCECYIGGYRQNLVGTNFLSALVCTLGFHKKFDPNWISATIDYTRDGWRYTHHYVVERCARCKVPLSARFLKVEKERIREIERSPGAWGDIEDAYFSAPPPREPCKHLSVCNPYYCRYPDHCDEYRRLEAVPAGCEYCGLQPTPDGVCPGCAHVNGPGRVCPYCGVERLPGSSHCPSCNRWLGAGEGPSSIYTSGGGPPAFISTKLPGLSARELEDLAWSMGVEMAKSRRGTSVY